jgi:hypothetical protein
MTETNSDKGRRSSPNLDVRANFPSGPKFDTAKPRSLEEYFARQGAQLDRRVVVGQEHFYLTILGRPGLYSIGACCYGWTEDSLWIAWCEHQRALAWHRLWAKNLVVQGEGMGPKGLASLSRWIKSKGMASQSDARSSKWPWLLISRSDAAEPLNYSGNPRLGIEDCPHEIDVLSLTNACVESQFDPTKPREYLLAMEALLSQSMRLWLQETTPCVDLERMPRRL